MKKRIVTVMLALTLAAAMTACGSKQEDVASAPASEDVSGGEDDSSKAPDLADTKAGTDAAANDGSADDTAAADEQGSAGANPELAEQAGRYTLYEYEANGTKVDHDTLVTAGMGDTYMELKEDGTGEFMLFNQLIDVKWEKNKITVYGTTDYPFELDGDTMIMDMQGVTYTMKKEGAASGGSEEADNDSSDSQDQAADSAAADDTQSASASGDIPKGDGIVTEEAVQKGYVWMNKINKDIFNTTYEDLAAYFGTDGAFDKEEYVENMEQNRRYYKWISDENDNHFIYVNFGEKDPEGAPGVYKITGYNSSGFDSAEAESKYLDQLKSEATEADKAAAGSAEMKDMTIKLYPFAHDEKAMQVSLSMPASGWSTDEGSGDYKLIENEDPQAFGAGFIKLKMDENIEKFDFYKDDFEDYKEIEDRTIGGITMKGRTYKNIGYEWTEYIGNVADDKAVSIGIVRVDISEGTLGDRILGSIKFE